MTALLGGTLHLARKRGLIGGKVRLAAIDSTGYEAGHTSVYFGRRAGQIKHNFPKLSVLCDTRSYLVLAAEAGIGPWPDDPFFEPLVRRSFGRVGIDTLLADAGYDSERAHVLVREELGGKSVIPPWRGRPSLKGPKGHWRRRMANRFPRKRYGQRWQVESLFSQDKRRFGSQLPTSSVKGQFGELCLRVLAHNIALHLQRRIQQSSNPLEMYAFNRANLTPF